MITMDKLISNVTKFKVYDIRKEIYGLFEPIVYNVVLLTRIDSGTGRASIGFPFSKEIIKSQRIRDAIDYDIEENASAYHYWENSFGIKDAKSDYKGTVEALISKNKIQVNIQSMDQGVVNQNQGHKMSKDSDTLASEYHPRDNSSRHIPYHIDLAGKILSSSSIDLENLSGNYWYPVVAQDIRERLKILTKAVEKRLFT